MRAETKILADALVREFKHQMAEAVAPLEKQVVLLEARLNALPKPERGEKGDAGASGKDGLSGKDGRDGIDGKNGADGLNGKDGATGKDGRDGIDGKNGADGINGKDGADGINGKDGAPGKDGRDGVDGKDGAPGKDGVDGKDGERGEKGEPGAKGLDGKDGAPGIDGKPGERGEKGVDGVNGKDGAVGSDGKDGRDGRDGKDGAAGVRGEKGDPGRDALAIDILPTIDETKSYPRGTFAEYRGGMIRAFRNTDPITGDLAAAGWSIAARGVWEETEELQADGRTTVRKTKYTCGGVLERKTKSTQMIYRDVYRPESEYDKGDVVTWAGSTWIAKVDKPTDKPGISEQWQLIVKRGAPGKDAK